MSHRTAALLGAALLAFASPPASHASEPVRTDHHVHVHSPEILAFLPAYCASPGRIGACAPTFVEPLTVTDLLEDMDEAGIGTAWMMSTGYLAESPMMVPPLADAPALVHAANAFTVGQARSHPDRLVAFIGVNPLTPTALDEIAAWKDDPFATGVKIHLTNSDVDLRDPNQVFRLATVFDAASAAGMTIMIHMRTRAEDYGARDVRIFVEQVLPRAGNTPVVIAHSGGWGGLDANTWNAMDGFRQVLAERPELKANLYFDLAQVFDADTPQADLARLARVMRAIDVDRFVPGSDWPFSGPLDKYLNEAMARLPLDPDETWLLQTRQVAGSARPNSPG
ncbi:MAG: amidohydrolase [Brevundimonas sp.]|uniref:amidohydrolase family protein n=1 Tax=Brevundimonas sp. TaxID=1871086 RepID=UPI000DB8CB40|nr:amidohydrolase family protein [Brevundimonas sp.]PZT99114.1 MAG: amidohydrolase [Brevundimonas sp.]